MLPLFLKDGLLVPYVVTSLAFLFFSIYLLSALEHCSEDELRLGACHKLFFCPPKMDLACIVRWKVSIFCFSAQMVGAAVSFVIIFKIQYLWLSSLDSFQRASLLT